MFVHSDGRLKAYAPVAGGVEARRCRTPFFGSAQRFNLQNGEKQLLELFDRVECIHFRDELAVTQVEPLIDYALSGIPDTLRDPQREALDHPSAHRRTTLERKSVIRIQKQTGLFTAQVVG